MGFDLITMWGMGTDEGDTANIARKTFRILQTKRICNR